MEDEKIEIPPQVMVLFGAFTSLFMMLLFCVVIGCAAQPKQEPQKQQIPHCIRDVHEDGSVTIRHQITQESTYRPDGSPCPCGMQDTPPTVQKITCGPSKEPINHGMKTKTLEQKLKEAQEREGTAPVASPDCSGGR